MITAYWTQLQLHIYVCMYSYKEKTIMANDAINVYAQNIASYKFNCDHIAIYINFEKSAQL